MKTWVVLLALALLASAAQAQTFPLGQPLTVVWGGALNEADAAVDRYEVQVDAEAWVPSGQAVPQTEYRYAIPQNLLTIGDHTITVRACAASSCGPSLLVAITVGRPIPGLPINPRVVPTPQPMVLTLPQAIDLANAYARLVLFRVLTQGELDYLAGLHGPSPPTRESVLTVLDAAFAPLVIQPQ